MLVTKNVPEAEYLKKQSKQQQQQQKDTWNVWAHTFHSVDVL